PCPGVRAPAFCCSGKIIASSGKIILTSGNTCSSLSSHFLLGEPQMPESDSVENKRNLLKSAACLLGLLASFAGAMYGQATVGTILGTATSSDGAPVADVSITVTNEGTHANRNVITGKQGDFVVSDLNPGTYTISGSAAGFAAFQNTGIVRESQQTI